ncbi:MAG: hypothetical protein K9W42_13900 [Candidatus Heimdallarchaeota archaeon]|nr:hypothetical protein [Candidatus Heimdallarchaeota archaeon]
MRAIFFHLLAKRKLLGKVILGIGFLSLIVLSFLFPIQFASPHIIRKYFKTSHLSTINENFEDEDSYFGGPDFIFSAGVEDIAFLNAFNQICRNASLQVYGIYQPLSIGYFCIEKAVFSNQTTEEWHIFGLNPEIYAELVSATNSSFDSAPILITSQPFSNGVYYFTSDDIGNFSLTFSHNLLFPVLEEKLPYFCSYLTYRPYGNTINSSRIILIPQEQFQIIFDMENYWFEGYLKFSSFQEDLLYWSLDATRKIGDFKNALYLDLQIAEPSISYGFFQSILDKAYIAESNAIIISFIYSFFRALQFIIWSLSGAMISLLVVKMKQQNENKEFQMLLAGKGFAMRFLTIFVENSLVLVGASIIAYSLLWPFVKLQSLLFHFSFTFNEPYVKLSLTYFPLFLFSLLLVISLDFEYHLFRALKNSQTESRGYRPFSYLPKFILYPVPLLLVVLLWFIQNSMKSFMIQIAFVLVVGFTGVLFFFLFNGVILACKKLVKKIKYHRDKPLSPFALFLDLWKKPIRIRLFLNVLVGGIIIGLCIVSIANVETQKVEMYAENDFCAVKAKISLPDNNTAPIEIFLQNHSSLKERYTTVLNVFHSPLPEDNSSFLDERQTIDDLLQNYCYLIGINLSEYLRFYSSWRAENWLQDDKPLKLNGPNVFASKSFAQLGYKLGDNITLANKQNVTIIGFLDEWIGIPYLNGFNLIFERQLLEHLLLDLNSPSFDYQFRFNVAEEDIQQTIVYLHSHLKSVVRHFQISYIPPEMIEGTKIVFLFPLIMTLESLALFIVAFSIYNNLTEINSSEKARTLGLMAMNVDFRKKILQMKFFELFLSVANISITILFIMALFVAIIHPLKFFPYVSFKEVLITGLGWSKNLFLYVTSVILMTLFVLVIESGFDYLRYRKIEPHLLFRHIE